MWDALKGYIDYPTGSTCSCVNEETDYHAKRDYHSPRFDLFSAHAVEHRHTADMALLTNRSGGRR